MAVYLLDKNVVEDIKQSLKGVHTTGAAVARSIDRKGSTVSPLLSIMEGSRRRAQSGSELYDQLMVDTQAVGLFYQLANTDFNFLRAFGVSAVSALTPHMREKASELVPLAMALQALVVQSRTWKGAREVLPKIDASAEEHQVSLSHPLVTCAVACLYGSSPARRVLKPAVNPTDEGAYNAVVDIRLVMDTAYIRKMWKEKGGKESVQLLSSDQDLNAFAKLLQLQVSAVKSDSEHDTVEFSATMSEGMLPILRSMPKEMERVLSHLEMSRSANQSKRSAV